jgi:hypothetical protein
MNLLTAGDSFTYGEELTDLQNAWPYLLGKKIHANVINLGRPASSNDKIFRLIFEHLITFNAPKPDLVVIGWTSPGRSEFADDIGYYDVWPGYGGNLFVKDGCSWRQQLADYISSYHNSEYLHKKFLQQVIMMQTFLTSRGIKYIMLNTVQNEYYKQHPIKTPDGSEYFSEVDKTQFLGFNKEGMAEWVEGCKKGPNGHFLDKGHEIVADRIYEHIRYLGWLS